MPVNWAAAAELDILAIIGIIIVAAFLGSKLFQRLGIPQVVGFIVMGTVLGTSFLNIIPLSLNSELGFISEIALGLIGFDMGGHLQFQEMRKLGGSIMIMLLFEAVGTFLLVTVGVHFLVDSWSTAFIFGALASATAPAATVDVLAEYDARGPLTTCILAVVGLDDALALILYSIAAAVAEALLSGGSSPTLLSMAEEPLYEIGGSLILGLGMGMLLSFILSRMRRRHDGMAVSIGLVMLAVGLSQSWGLSLILTSMIVGSTVVNRVPENGRHIRFTIEQAGPVIYVLFFALVGARFQIRSLGSLGALGIMYVLLRSAGKYAGAWLGGTVAKVPPAVRDNLGFGLLSQAGVAIGLALASAERFSHYGQEGQALGSLIINVITCTTFIVQIIGPMFVKLAIRRAGEIGQARLDSDPWASEGVVK